MRSAGSAASRSGSDSAGCLHLTLSVVVHEASVGREILRRGRRVGDGHVGVRVLTARHDDGGGGGCGSGRMGISCLEL